MERETFLLIPMGKKLLEESCAREKRKKKTNNLTSALSGILL